MQSIFDSSQRTYGIRRIRMALRGQGLRCGRARVVRLMQQLALQVPFNRRRISTTQAKQHDPTGENKLNRDFIAQQPNQKWLVDITYIDTQEGTLYLASVLDVFSRKIVGWAMADHMRDKLMQAALAMALRARQPQPGLLHHSDRGAQYTSADYQAVFEKFGIQVSLSRAHNCFDNAPMESFWGTLKTECVYRHTFHTRSEAKNVIFAYLEVFYNRQRLHSTLGYLSPEKFERVHATS
ncbi:MAG: IS3 family transposase [Anaerolineae bacterium]|nr:IS3 family transposase [Anaerolineae bacterium]